MCARWRRTVPPREGGQAAIWSAYSPAPGPSPRCRAGRGFPPRTGTCPPRSCPSLAGCYGCRTIYLYISLHNCRTRKHAHLITHQSPHATTDTCGLPSHGAAARSARVAGVSSPRSLVATDTTLCAQAKLSTSTTCKTIFF